MEQNESTNVLTAFEMLLEEVENEIEFVNSAGAKAFAERNYERVEAVRTQALKLTDFRNQAAVLRQEWQALMREVNADVPDDPKTQAERRNLGRLKRGARTPEDAYRLPILKALTDLGGSAPIGDVLARVEKQMKTQFKEIDFETLPSNPNMQRWRNTAQWARNSMVKESLMKADSPYGIWEISEAGRQSLKKHSSL